ncbi:hypothetical protein GWO43_01765 [candidate division KSB1 bacterium]|nr:hypothetical protein [candidate division KSB1 bacterium]NIR69454.1 hypothetical protein [candidate division KSB1 bacterium]NIS22803.1 hypothetical protein [candidate division KSB1 bacterium]NIT69643.1 hypothetical protein [candidate division KSB1 bacterium]NIU23312.1 hypothetical protein [candidate division KSB1 bacterium]
MKPTIQKFISSVLYTVFVSWMTCSVDPLSPEALRGSWTMLSLTDKRTNTTFVADRPVDIGNGATRTVSGVLLIGDFGAALQESEINIIISTRTTIPGQGQQDDFERFFGTYDIEGFTLTIDGTKVFKISRSEFRLTLEDDESIIRWGKTD